VAQIIVTENGKGPRSVSLSHVAALRELRELMKPQRLPGAAATFCGAAPVGPTLNQGGSSLNRRA
jgi:hypothetical protein